MSWTEKAAGTQHMSGETPWVVETSRRSHGRDYFTTTPRSAMQLASCCKSWGLSFSMQFWTRQHLWYPQKRKGWWWNTPLCWASPCSLYLTDLHCGSIMHWFCITMAREVMSCELSALSKEPVICWRWYLVLNWTQRNDLLCKRRNRTWKPSYLRCEWIELHFFWIGIEPSPLVARRWKRAWRNWKRLHRIERNIRYAAVIPWYHHYINYCIQVYAAAKAFIDTIKSLAQGDVSEGKSRPVQLPIYVDESHEITKAEGKIEGERNGFQVLCSSLNKLLKLDLVSVGWSTRRVLRYKTRTSNSAHQDCHAYFKFSVEQARVSSQSLATKICTEFVFYIRVIDIQKFQRPWSIEILPTLFPRNQ